VFEPNDEPLIGVTPITPAKFVIFRIQQVWRFFT
jgi:hypothetical protein